MQAQSNAANHPAKREPLIFEEYFELGQRETESPFITKDTRAWSRNLDLKAAILAAALLIAAFVLSFDPQWLPLSKVLLIFVYFLAGTPSLIESVEDLSNFEVNIDVLMTLAAFSSVFIGSGMEGGLLLVLFSLSGSMEEAVSSKAKSAISSLHNLSPTTAFLLREDKTLVEKSVKEVQVNETIFVKAGQVVPLDGEVLEGTSSVNLVHLTGENLPVRKQKGDLVAAGAQNLEGALTLRVARTCQDSTLAKIIRLVTEAQDAKPKLQRWFDKFSHRYALSIIGLSFLFAALFPILFGIPFLGVEGSLYRALAFLIAASPCALIIALPIAYLSAVSICARNGILLKGGIVLDRLASCRAVAFDKTGTLTTGKLQCTMLRGLKETTQEELHFALKVAHALEQGAIHPIAKALLQLAEERGASPVALNNFRSIPGFGLEGTVETEQGERDAFIGQPEWALDKIPPDEKESLQQAIDEIRKKGELLSVLLIGNKIFLFKFSDSARPGIRRTLDALKNHWKLTLVMLTGDHGASASRIAAELGIEKYYFDLKPEDKLAKVSELAQVEGLAMVGDGINDAPALARATVGICMGQVGMTSAMEASDIVLLHDNIELLDWLFGKAKKTQTIVNQNLLVAIGAILIACIPALFGIVPLWLAVILHEGGTVLVGLNALRLLRR